MINRYAADGRKLFTLYFTKKTQLITPIDTGAVYNYVFSHNLMTQSQTDYVGNIEYVVGSLKVHNSEGYSDTFNNGYVSTFYYYYRQDHLGNNREVWQAPYIIYVANNAVNPASVVQRTQYYPSGLPWSEGLSPNRTKNCKGTGKT